MSSATSSASATHSVKAATFADAKKALSKDHPVVMVLGDSTGYSEDQWASLWSQKIAQNRGVEYHTWNWRSDDGYFPDVTRRGGDQRKVTFWNGSKPGATANYQVEHWDQVGKKADLVILNFGHNGGTDVARQDRDLDALLRKVKASSPNAVIVGTAQNPEANDQNKAKREAVVAWNKRNGIPTIDVNAAFVKDGRGDQLRRDDIHPNDQGQKVWAQAVEDALGTAS